MPGNTNTVAVLIPSYNGGESLLETLASIAPEEYVDVIVVDDGSIQKPRQVVLDEAFRGHGRVILHCLEKNLGIVGALNTGLKIAEQHGYRYIARLDAGDRNIGIRFEHQARFLDENQDHALVGAWVNFVSPEGKLLFTLKHPERHEDIRKAMYRYNPFVHPATMFRLSAIAEQGGYPDDYPALEDWACFLSMCQRYKASNLPQVLLEYEVSPDSISTRKRYMQSRSKVKLLARHYSPNLNQTVGLLKSTAIMLLPRGALTQVKKLLLNRG